VASYDAAIALKADYADAHLNRALALAELEQYQAALEGNSRVIALEPKYVEAYFNRANIYRQLGQWEAALSDYTFAVHYRPDHAEAHQSKAITSLLLGDFERGWPEYEWRWKNHGSHLMCHRRGFEQPRWLGGESLASKTILLHSEQGLGDTLQFCRYVPMVAQLGARVILEVQPQLVSLLASLDGAWAVLARGDALPEFDCWCPLLSLPLAFGTTLASIPAAVPYLRSRPQKSLLWKARLGEKTKPRVGLAWSGGFRPDHPALERRNIPPVKLAPLRCPQVEFYSLQKGEPAQSHLRELVDRNWGGPALSDFADGWHDLEDTAALIEQLDLVISVDTSIAHLAGALAKPVWILSRFDGCWRWLLGRTDSPWYPTARLYRQERAGDWDAVIGKVAEDLRRHHPLTS
jgi:tetratricopeptide (TPR) repeat protein